MQKIAATAELLWWSNRNADWRKYDKTFLKWKFSDWTKLMQTKQVPRIIIATVRPVKTSEFLLWCKRQTQPGVGIRRLKKHRRSFELSLGAVKRCVWHVIIVFENLFKLEEIETVDVFLLIPLWVAGVKMNMLGCMHVCTFNFTFSNHFFFHNKSIWNLAASHRHYLWLSRAAAAIWYTFIRRHKVNTFNYDLNKCIG